MPSMWWPSELSMIVDPGIYRTRWTEEEPSTVSLTTEPIPCTNSVDPIVGAEMGHGAVASVWEVGESSNSKPTDENHSEVLPPGHMPGMKTTNVQVVQRKGKRPRPLRPPPGFHFKPSDEELAFGYLLNKTLHGSVPYDCMKDYNVYSQHPEKFINEDDHQMWRHEGRWYFFTERERKYARGQRPSRHIHDGTGFWKATGLAKTLKRGEVTVKKSTLVLFTGKNSRTDWLMHEYVIQNPIEQQHAKGSKQKPRKEPANKMQKLMGKSLCVIYKCQRARDGDVKVDEGEADQQAQGRKKRRHEQGDESSPQGSNACDNDRNSIDIRNNNWPIVLKGDLPQEATNGSMEDQLLRVTGVGPGQQGVDLDMQESFLLDYWDLPEDWDPMEDLPWDADDA